MTIVIAVDQTDITPMCVVTVLGYKPVIHS
jgi:hypothetical protein